MPWMSPTSSPPTNQQQAPAMPRLGARHTTARLLHTLPGHHTTPPGWRVVGGATVKEVLVVAMAMAVVAGGRGMAREARESGRGRGGSLW